MDISFSTHMTSRECLIPCADGLTDCMEGVNGSRLLSIVEAVQCQIQGRSNLFLRISEVSHGSTGLDAGFRCYKLFQEFLSGCIVPLQGFLSECILLRRLGQLRRSHVSATKASA